MKVIDLLNRIADEEKVPEKIQVYSDIFVLNCSNMVYEHEKTRTNLLSIYNGNILNYEVAIIEDKKIEKFKFGEIEDGEHYEIKRKINEIIEVLNEVREDK